MIGAFALIELPKPSLANLSRRIHDLALEGIDPSLISASLAAQRPRVLDLRGAALDHGLPFFHRRFLRIPGTLRERLRLGQRFSRLG